VLKKSIYLNVGNSTAFETKSYISSIKNAGRTNSSVCKPITPMSNVTRISILERSLYSSGYGTEIDTDRHDTYSNKPPVSALDSISCTIFSKSNILKPKLSPNRTFYKLDSHTRPKTSTTSINALNLETKDSNRRIKSSIQTRKSSIDAVDDEIKYTEESLPDNPTDKMENMESYENISSKDPYMMISRNNCQNIRSFEIFESFKSFTKLYPECYKIFNYWIDIDVLLNKNTTLKDISIYIIRKYCDQCLSTALSHYQLSLMSLNKPVGNINMEDIYKSVEYSTRSILYYWSPRFINHQLFQQSLCNILLDRPTEEDFMTNFNVFGKHLTQYGIYMKDLLKNNLNCQSINSILNIINCDSKVGNCLYNFIKRENYTTGKIYMEFVENVIKFKNLYCDEMQYNYDLYASIEAKKIISKFIAPTSKYSKLWKIKDKENIFQSQYPVYEELFDKLLHKSILEIRIIIISMYRRYIQSIKVFKRQRKMSAKTFSYKFINQDLNKIDHIESLACADPLQL
ncbi:hypothetical protein A3Q56_06607, partial [Intoshia linei]